MSEIGALVVKLTAETAQFREDLGKVKRNLDDLGEGGHRAGRGMNEGMGEAKGGLMLFEDAVGVRLPRHLNSLIAEIPGVGAAFAAMLPIAGVLVAIKVIGELITKHEEMKEKLAASENAQRGLGTAINNTLAGLDAKLLQSGIKVDELRKNHFAALTKELELIDQQSMSDLLQTFDKLADKANAYFQTMSSGLMTLGNNASGAKTSLADFQSEYGAALSKALALKATADKLKDGSREKAEAEKAATEALAESNGLLDRKVKREETVLGLIREYARTDGNATERYNRQVVAAEKFLALTGQRISYGDEVIKSESEMVNILHAQQAAREVSNQTAASDKTGAKLAEAKRGQEDSNKSMEQQLALQHVLLAGTDAHIAAVRKLAQTNAEAALAATKTPEQSTTDESGHKLAEIELERNAAVQSANDELNAKKRAYDADAKAAQSNKAKLKELDAQYKNDVVATADAIAQANADAGAKSVAVNTEAKNEQTRQAIAAAQEQYDGELKDAIKDAQDKQKLAVETAKNLQAVGKLTSAQTLQLESHANTVLAGVEKAAYDKRISLLDKFSKDYTKQVAKLNAEVLADTKKGAAEVTQETISSEQRKAQAIVSAENRMKDAIATDIAHSIVMNKSLAQAFRQTGEEMAEGMIKNLILMELNHDKTKLMDAKDAFANSYKWASAWGGPIAGGVAGAAAFASVMSFEVGGKIPGSGPVPITGHGGETVVTKALTDRVEASERGGGNSGGSGGGEMHMHYAPQIHAVDAKGVDDMLSKHGAIFQRHITATMRRMNKN